MMDDQQEARKEAADEYLTEIPRYFASSIAPSAGVGFDHAADEIPRRDISWEKYFALALYKDDAPGDVQRALKKIWLKRGSAVAKNMNDAIKPVRRWLDAGCPLSTVTGSGADVPAEILTLLKKAHTLPKGSTEAKALRKFAEERWAGTDNQIRGLYLLGVRQTNIADILCKTRSNVHRAVKGKA